MMTQTRALTPLTLILLAGLTQACGGLGADDDGGGGNGGQGGSGGNAGLYDVEAMDGGEGHTLALLADGTVLGLGMDSDGQLAQGDSGVGLTWEPLLLQDASDVIAIAAGNYMSYLVQQDGSVVAAGYNDGGILGTGDDSSARLYTLTPVQISGVTAIAASADIALAITSNGDVWSWGENNSGEAGLGHSDDVLIPTRIETIEEIVEVRAGGGHAMALDAGGTVYLWGNNLQGQLGNGNTLNALSPQIVMGLPSGITDIACSGEHALALAPDGRVWSWGRNSYGELGLGSEGQDPVPPSEIPSLSDIVAIDAGPNWSMALDSEGHVWIWGSHNNLVYGSGYNQMASSVPVQVPGLDNVVTIANGHRTALAQKTDGSWWGWGYAEFGALGPTSIDPNTPDPVQIY